MMPGGERIEFTSTVASSRPRHRPGERIQALYPADNPHAAQIDDVMSRGFVPLILGFIGLVFSLIGALTRWIASGQQANTSTPD